MFPFLDSQIASWYRVGLRCRYKECKKTSTCGSVTDGCEVLFGLLIGIFEGVVGQCCFVACVLHHVVPCDQSLANGCSPRLKTLLGRKKATISGTSFDKENKLLSSYVYILMVQMIDHCGRHTLTINSSCNVHASLHSIAQFKFARSTQYELIEA